MLVFEGNGVRFSVEVVVVVVCGFMLLFEGKGIGFSVEVIVVVVCGFRLLFVGNGVVFVVVEVPELPGLKDPMLIVILPFCFLEGFGPMASRAGSVVCSEE